MLNNKIYDILKWVVSTALPAAIVLYVLLSETWGWAYTMEISTTLMGVEAFLGVLLGISTASYNKTLK